MPTRRLRPTTTARAPLQRHTNLVEQAHHAERRAGPQARLARQQAPLAHGMETVDVLLGWNRFDHGLRVEAGRQRELHQNAVHTGIVARASGPGRAGPPATWRREGGGRTTRSRPPDRLAPCCRRRPATPDRRRPARSPGRLHARVPQVAPLVPGPRSAPPPQPPCRRSSVPRASFRSTAFSARGAGRGKCA